MRTLLIAGFGDVARRAVPLLAGHWRLMALVRTPLRQEQARQLGVLPILADLDQRSTLARLPGRIDAVLYTAPPACSRHEARLLNLLSAFGKTHSIPQHWVYISTTGVYGDRGGRWLDETAAVDPQSARAGRRLAAETLLRRFAVRHGISLTVLRTPGIYAEDRLPLERIRQRLPIPLAQDDGFGNHIHADDLAAICARALLRQGGIRIYHACDAEPMRHGDWFERVADLAGLPRPPRRARAELQSALSAAALSFFDESRRLDNRRLVRELGLRLRYPSFDAFAAELAGNRKFR